MGRQPPPHGADRPLVQQGPPLAQRQLARVSDAALPGRPERLAPEIPAPRHRNATALTYLPQNYDLAVEVIRCRRLVKGYSDTHARGLSKYERVLATIALIKDRDDAAPWAARLREAALKDEEGKALDGAIATIRSFV